MPDHPAETQLPHPALDESRIAALLLAYLSADYRWGHHGSWHDVLIGLPTPGLELAYPQARSFGLLSAWNPGSVERPLDVNRAADEALQAELETSGIRCLPAFASASNRTWREPSWLVFDMSAEAFDALTLRYGQLGTLWWQPHQPVRLRMLAPRPPGVDNDEHVDWLGPVR
ncbi:DUF3293 domain-containing protein [Luteimonas sp. RIT-PG2_3]